MEVTVRRARVALAGKAAVDGPRRPPASHLSLAPTGGGRQFQTAHPVVRPSD
jgi:hypothetical protein